MELWKTIKGYEGKYQISNEGRVRRLKKWDIGTKHFINCCDILYASDNGCGYLYVGLYKEGKRKNFFIHRLVAEYFIPKITGKNYVNHLNYNKRDNRAENLEWCTQRENVIHSIPNMRHRKNVTHSNTGEKYISKVKNGKFRVTIDGKFRGHFRTLAEAIDKRNEEVMI